MILAIQFAGSEQSGLLKDVPVPRCLKAGIGEEVQFEKSDSSFNTHLV